jgi:glutathione S-transferase
MSLTLYLHPLSSYCHKSLIALYETGTPFETVEVNLGDPQSASAFKAIWPVGKFPVLRDGANGRVIPESTSIIEYLARHHPGPAKLIPEQPEAAFEVRARDRFYDLHVHTHIQRIIGERLRPAESKDPYGLEQAKSALAVALALAEREMAGRTWAAGEEFSMADCAAAPPLFYLDFAVEPIAGSYPNLAAYLGRLKQRPSYARALKEAEPYLQFVPR